MNWNQKTMKDILADRAKALGIRMPQAQNLLAQERFLARLAKTEFGTKFIWKGGSLVLRAYSSLEIPRYTVDLDFLAKGISIDKVQAAFVKATEVHLDDGFVFGRITNGPIERDLPYGGERFEIAWTLFDKQNSESLKIDVAAGDVVTPRQVDANKLFLCPDADETLTLLVYPPEFIIAEKLETVLNFGTGNTRVKDLIDLWTLKRNVAPQETITAIHQCFTNRKTELNWPEIKEILSDDDYITFVNEAIQRNYSYLKLQSTEVIMKDLVVWVNELSNL
jgi:predicted nucleotidyltransferase component of viral defense system